jgi:hypothetical protein
LWHSVLLPLTGRPVKGLILAREGANSWRFVSVTTPLNWKDDGDVIIVNSITDEEAKTRFPKGLEKLKDYLRVTPQPNKQPRLASCFLCWGYLRGWSQRKNND